MEAVARNPEEALKPRRQMRIKPLRFKPFMAGESAPFGVSSAC
jgi:hypothetical protein